MSSPPPAKRLKQSTIVEAFKEQQSLETDGDKYSEQGLSDTQPDMFGSDDPVKQFRKFQSSEKNKTGEIRRPKFSPAKRQDDVRYNKQQDNPCASASTSSTSRQADEDQVDSQTSVASSGDGAQGPRSPPLFDSDIELLEDPDPSLSAPVKDAAASVSMGTPITDLYTYPKSLPPMGELASSRHHTVLVKTPYKCGEMPEPHPKGYVDRWDADHVRMPCSPENLYPVEGKAGSKALKSRWELIEEALCQGISSSLDLEEAILTYNTRYNQRWDFTGLHSFFTEVVEAEEAEAFFTHTMPKIVTLALQLPQLCNQPIPMLKKHHNHTITMSHHQAASLLANAFFCTFPRRNSNKRQSEYSTYPDINFSSLFQGGNHRKVHRKAEKLKCIINYFRRVTKEMPQGTLTFRRQCIKEFPRWDLSSSTLSRLHVSATGRIEDDGLGMLQVDFANKYLGGGVLGYGCVQEEIRFLLCPELILSRLFTEVLDRNECLIMTGCETFSKYTGYADTFKWAGDFVDTTPRDPWGRRCTELVAIDALVFRTYHDQFQENLVRRELNKAYCGFLSPGVGPRHLAAVATGNWGCGAFGGDLQLKALLQLMAAAEAKRDVCYFTFHNFDLMEELSKIHDFFVSKDLSISDIYNLIKQYYDNICLRSSRNRRPKVTLYEYIYTVYSGYDEDTDRAPDSDGDVSQEVRSHWANKYSPDYAANTP